MKSIIYTYLYNDTDIKRVAALGNSIRLYSQMKSVCVCTPDIPTQDRKRLYKYFSDIEVSPTPLSHIVSNDDLDRVMIISPDTVLTRKVDILLSMDTPSGSPDLTVIVIRPNRVIPKLYTIDREIRSVREAYVDAGYTWSTLDAIYDKRPSTSIIDTMYAGTYISKIEGLIPLLKRILSGILGDRGSDAVDRETYTYIMVFSHSSVNPTSNYEMLEAYGDGILKGGYMWVLSSIPGIVDQDQITKISDYYMGNEVLSDICDRLGLTPYITTNNIIDRKVKADIVEALIGAIAFSHDRLYNEGCSSSRKFIEHIYSLYTIDVTGYKERYTSPVQLLNEYIQRLSLDRKKLGHKVDIGRDKITYYITYNDTIVGVGIVDRTGENIQEQEKLAKVEASKDVLSKKSLERFVRK